MAVSDKGQIVNNHTVRLERLLPGPVERVWDHFTDSQCLSSWLMKASVEPQLDGLIELVSEAIPEGTIEGDEQEPHEFAIRGLIGVFDAPRTFAFSWYEPTYNSASEFKIELEQRGDQVLLVLVHSQLEPDFMAAVAAGWHTHLETLLAVLQGKEKPDFYPRFNQLLEEYKPLVAGAGIVIVTAGSALPASASELSNSAYKEVSAHRQRLLVQYDSIWKDANDIKSDISRLERAANRDERALDSLHRDLKYKKDDLRKLELDIRDLNSVLR